MGGVGPLADRGTFNPAVPALRLGRPAFSRRLDWRGLFTVLADRGASRTRGLAPVQAHRVCGYSVGPLSDPS